MSYNCYHILRPNDCLSMQTNFIFFDTEAWIKKIDDKTQEQTFRLGWLKYKNFENNKEEYFYYEDVNMFWDYVETHVGPRELYLIAHNTDYDMKISDGYNELVVKRGWKVEKIFIEANVFILHLKKNNQKIHILDSMNYSPKSLASIGKSLGIPKMKINFKTCTHEELKTYCKNDVLILATFMEQLIEFLRVNELTRLKNTAGAIAFNGFRHKYYDYENKPIHIHNYKNIIRDERKSYRGGICDCFKVGYFADKLVKLDINSMYPYVMRKYPVPVEYKYSKTNAKVETLKEYLKTDHVIADCTITLPEEYAYILTPIKIEGAKKSVFLKGTFRGTYSTPELEFILKYGTIDRIWKMNIYRKENIFTEYVNELYGQRMTYEKEGNKAFADFCKILLNSLYGKFGQRAFKSDEILPIDDRMNDDDMPDIYGIRVMDGESYTRIRIGEKRFKLKKTDDNSFDSFVAVASIITAYARMYLIEMLLKAGRENVYYADTDCLIMKASEMDRMNEFMDDGSKELGKLKNEGFSTNTVIIRPKFYMFNGDRKCKGVRKSVFEHEEEDTDNVIVSEDDNMLIVEQQQFERFKTSARLGNMNKVIVKQLTKEIKKTYDKGSIRNGVVRPFDASTVELCTMR